MDRTLSLWWRSCRSTGTIAIPVAQVSKILCGTNTRDVQGGVACHRLPPAQTSPAQGCSERNPGELCGEPRSLPCPVPALAAAAGAWKFPGSLSVFKTPQQQHPLARSQPQRQSEPLCRVRACVPFTGISPWQFSGCCNLHPEEVRQLSRPSL